MDEFNKYMTPPQEINGEAYSELYGDKFWIHCPFCGKKQFPLSEGAIIQNQVFQCKKCKQEFLVNT